MFEGSIAVYSGNLYTFVGDVSGGRNHLIESLMPVTSWGLVFFLVPFPGRTNDFQVKIGSSDASTVIQKDGNTLGTITSAGSYLTHQTKVAFRIDASVGVQVAQLAIGSSAATNK